ASVIGRGFAYKILQTITGQHEELKSVLFNLQGLEFIYEKQLFPELEYIFKHALIQEVAYNSLLQKRRKEIHESIGNAIETIYADRLEEFYEMLAHHYIAADNDDKALHYLQLSCFKAQGNHAHKEVLAFGQQSLILLGKQPQTDVLKKARMDVCGVIWTADLALGLSDATLNILLEGEKLAKELKSKKGEDLFSQSIGFYYTLTGKPELALERAEKSFNQAIHDKDTFSVAYGGNSLAMTYFGVNNYPQAIETSNAVLSYLDKEDALDETISVQYVDMCGRYSFMMCVLGDFRKAKVYCEKGLQRANHVNELFSQSMAEMWYSNYWSLKGDGKSAEKHDQNAMRYAEQRNDSRSIAIMKANKVKISYLIGNLEQSLDFGEQIVNEVDGKVQPMTMVYVYLSLSGYY
ncbi:hypothetical protein KKI24_22775, partial [bacterium]|nr:hypothetical protein [bacterium]